MKFTDPQNILSIARRKSDVDSPWVAILGNPNSGKTALFNRLTGLHHKVGNYPGVTVEKKEGRLRGHSLLIRDLPGCYSLEARSADEKIVSELVHAWRDATKRPRAVLVVLDATNLSRSIYLALQILEFGIPTILILNMIDEARKQNLEIDVLALKQELGAYEVIETSAKTGEGVDRLIRVLIELEATDDDPPNEARLRLAPHVLQALEPLTQVLARFRSKLILPPIIDAVRCVERERHFDSIAPLLSEWEEKELKSALERTRGELERLKQSLHGLEANGRYEFIDHVLDRCQVTNRTSHRSVSERLDAVLLHPVFGLLSLVMVLGFVFNSIFTWATYPMEWIESGIGHLAAGIKAWLPDGPLQSLVADGIIPGVGNVIVFLPQIVMLIFFLALLEDSGYMSRIAFLLDRLLQRFGLQGKAVLPMLSGFACAIPAIMAARTIENRRDRLIVILLIPLMSCSARLPVYTLLISAFVPQRTLLGFIQLQGLVFMGIYFLGFLTAILAARIIRWFANKKSHPPFIMELPPYRWPMLQSVWFKVYDGAKLFLVNAGSIILAFSILLWFLASHPKADADARLSPRQQIEQSYAGQLGHAIEPAIRPLGFDWKIGVGLITSFAAREVIIASFATIYNLQETEAEASPSLIEALRHDRKADGTPTYSTLVAISLLVFFVYAAQCMSTFAIVRRETNSWRWPLVMVFGMTTFAYLAALLVYQGGKAIGLG